MNDAFVFCTSYFDSKAAWERRYLRWIDHHGKVFPDTPLVLIDDASPYSPEDHAISISGDLSRMALGERASIFRFPNRLGRPSLLDYPGWFRSFTHSVEIARRFGFKKIVHVESDAFILTRKARDFIAEARSGWTALWYSDEAFAETCVQIICADRFASLNRFRVAPYQTQYSGKLIELYLPFTRIERSLQGSRYAGPSVPKGADFAVLLDGEATFASEFD